MSLILLAGSGAAARDAGVVAVAGDAGSAARLAAVFGTVTSIHRTVERNRLVGGVPNSYHLAGRAIDVARKPASPTIRSRPRFAAPATTSSNC